MIKVGVIGLGLMGQKRIGSIVTSGPECQLVAVCDVKREVAEKIAAQFSVRFYTDWEQMLARDEMEALVISTPNVFSAPIALRACEKAIHLFCEKPLGLNSREAAIIYRAAQRKGIVLKVGFTLRFHPAIEEAWKRVQAGEIGRLLYGRAIYGHGGRPGYEQEWRASRRLAGGGELLDQGVHLIDLFRFFFGPVEEVFGLTPTLYWKMEVEDNAFAFLRTFAGQILMMQASWTQWKNKFIFEIFGEKGYLLIDGLGGSYGPETLILGLKKGNVPEEKRFSFPDPDKALIAEWQDFVAAVKGKKETRGSGWDGFMANFIVETLYESAREKKPICLPPEEKLKEALFPE